MLRHLRTVAAALTDLPGLTALSRLGGLPRSALATVRDVGIVPTAAAILSTPAVTVHLLRAAEAVDHGLARLARSA